LLSSDPIMGDFEEHGFKGAIPKPFAKEELGDLLKEVIMDRDE
jgi:hypothetical protein